MSRKIRFPDMARLLKIIQWLFVSVWKGRVTGPEGKVGSKNSENTMSVPDSVSSPTPVITPASQTSSASESTSGSGSRISLTQGVRMELEVLRFSSQKDSTLGILSSLTPVRKFLCFTLEDEYRTAKVYGETRIPAGRYKLALKVDGSFHEKYRQKFPQMHKGMLWVTNVPDFESVLIHIGNNDDDTAGCLLVGDTVNQNITEKGFIGNSSAAYTRIYPVIAEAVEKGDVWITYLDYDEPVS